ncbi:MAG: outer membrane protein assembly factor BamD [Paucibacter sp.]|nr:outer membrane protein assembly factor BamD [Roseateles sp.]
MSENSKGRLALMNAVAAGLIGATVLLAGCSSTKDDPNSQAGLDKLYKEAKDDLDSGAWDRAIKGFEKVEGRAAGTVMAQQAMLNEAWANYKSGEKAAAITVLDRFIKLNPSSAAMDYALYLKGIVNFNDDLGLFGRLAQQNVTERDQQASRDALLAFRELVERFPDSKYAEDAAFRVDYISNALAAYEIHVARYYYNRGAFMAAANRAQRAIADYPHAPTGEEALHLMVQAYDKLDLPELRNDAERVLKLNYPDSRYLRGEQDTKKAWWKFW